MTITSDVWLYEGLEWNNKTQRSRKVRYWCVRMGDKCWEGFGTRDEAKSYLTKVFAGTI